MAAGLSIAFFGSSLVSAYWNGAATYYRGMLAALHRRGHRIAFYEPDAFDRQRHRDLENPEYARSVVYPARDERDVFAALERARGADLVIKASGVGVFDGLLERCVLDLRSARTRVAFWDVDAAATLERLGRDPGDPFRTLVPRYDLIFLYGGGPAAVRGYRDLGARACAPIYNAVDPDIHHPVPPEPRYRGALGFLGNRMPDREARAAEFFFAPARANPALSFLLAGAGWEVNAPRFANVRYLGHLYTREHNAFYSTPLAALNVHRESMARWGYSPATRVFEAAGAAACLITDASQGIELFLEPGRECLVARCGEEVSEQLRALPPERARAIGAAARRRVLSEHTYAHRAAAFERAVAGG